MKSSEIIGKRILLLGYGREGQSTHRFLLAHSPEISISIADKSPVTPVAPVPNLHLGAEYLNSLNTYDTVIRSPGVPTHLPELEAYRKNGGSVTSATNIFFSLCKGKTIGVTGTKGKSTTSALIAHILRTKFADVRLVGNIGNPMLDELASATPQTIFVLELSSHQLADARFSPQIAVILNIVPEHFDYYANLESYAKAKANIVRFQKENDMVIFNPTQNLVESLVKKDVKSSRRTFAAGKEPGALAWVEGNVVMIQKGERTEPVVAVSDIPLKGNQENILAAVAVAAIFEVPPDAMRAAITTFQALPHRLELVGGFKGITFYNDSLATIPEATIHALEALGPTVETLIAGGFDRGLDYTKLGQFLAKREGLKTLILFPDTGQLIWEAVSKAAPETALENFAVNSMEEAVALAFRKTAAGKICLLSPASASFNLFKDYAERGDLFKKLVAVA